MSEIPERATHSLLLRLDCSVGHRSLALAFDPSDSQEHFA